MDSSLMLPALSGSGVTVTLDDSPLWENAVNNNGTTANINDYVIHQQDVESVVNALCRRCRCADDYGSAGAVQFGGHLFRQRAVVAR